MPRLVLLLLLATLAAPVASAEAAVGCGPVYVTVDASQFPPNVGYRVSVDGCAAYAAGEATRLACELLGPAC